MPSRWTLTPAGPGSLSKTGPAARAPSLHTPSWSAGHSAPWTCCEWPALPSLWLWAAQPRSIGWMRGRRVNFSVIMTQFWKNAASPGYSFWSSARGREAWREFSVWAPGGSWPRGCVCASLCACVHAFSRGFLLSCSCGPVSGEAPGEKEKAQHAMTPDGKYYALVNEADVSALTLAF